MSKVPWRQIVACDYFNSICLLSIAITSYVFNKMLMYLKLILDPSSGYVMFLNHIQNLSQWK